jgi:hypothetical protein
VFNRQTRWIAGSVALMLLGLGVCSPVSGREPLADPTRPAATFGPVAGAAAEKPAKWLLSSTLIAAQRRIAVINGQAVQVGQIIDGAELLAVEPGRALLRRAGQTMELKLMPGTVKQAVEPAL